jgi:glycosyltransferase involved in cell wall biosynthesis
MASTNGLRVAWLFPSLEFGNYWHPVLSEFTKLYCQTRVYTGVWKGFSSGFEDTFKVKVVGKMRFIDSIKSETGYSQGFIYASPEILKELLTFKPQVIFTTGFCIWTIFSLLLKPLGRWRVVITYDGSSPGVDYCHSPLRLFLRRLMSRLTDAFITNSHAGKVYLTHILGVPEQVVFARPYEVPDVDALLKQLEIEQGELKLQRPVFLFTGQLIPRKGVHCLLEACKFLKDLGCEQYTLLVAGDGSQRMELEARSQEYGLEDCVKWLGWVSYSSLGSYFQYADVFVLPTLEDIWGVVVLEAMAFGKPVLCSHLAGASELVINGENGYLFDPHQIEAIAQAMRRFIDHPDLIQSMGQRSQALIAQHTPKAAAQFLAQVTDTVVGA